MAADGAAGEQQDTSVETLRKEIESLKVKLDEERQKMNDVTREFAARRRSRWSSVAA